MRIRITHETTYRYAEPVKSTVQMLRLTPRGHEGQTVLKWFIDTDSDAHLIQGEDWYGNAMHTLYGQGPLERITLKVSGEVETTDTAGIVRDTVERFPALFYLRETLLTQADMAIRTFAQDVAGSSGDPLNQAQSLMLALHERMRFDPAATDVATSAVEAFASGHGVCQDFTHVFLAATRHLGIPARYVSGYLHRPDQVLQEAGHAWAEAYIPDLGWVSFDSANAISATEHYIRVAIGLDYLDAAPVRGSYYGSSNEDLGVSLKIENLGQAQS